MSKLALLLVAVMGCASTAKPVTCPVCPAASPPVATTAPAPAEAPKVPAGVEYSASVESNLAKAREAVAQKNYPAARAYYEFILARFPLSASVHDVELGLAELGVLEQPVIGSTYDTAPFCRFIEHHPFHPQVVSGEIGCRIVKLQAPNESCDPKKQIAPAKYCTLDYCKQPAAASRPECKGTPP